MPQLLRDDGELSYYPGTWSLVSIRPGTGGWSLHRPGARPGGCGRPPRPPWSLRSSDGGNKVTANKSVPRNDIPTKVLKRFSGMLCEPIADLINDCIAEGVWPDFLKIESVTPVPKVTNPKSANELRLLGCPT